MAAEAGKEIVVPAEEATFWMDRWGRWCNRHGRFQHKKIIAYFHAAIARDEKGYFVSQVNGDVHEKVYFRYEDTALFVFAVRIGEPVELLLNTGRRIPLDPRALFIRRDNLYTRHEGELIKFDQPSMLTIGRHFTYESGRCLLNVQGRCFEVAAAADAAGEKAIRAGSGPAEGKDWIDGRQGLPKPEE